MNKFGSKQHKDEKKNEKCKQKMHDLSIKLHLNFTNHYALSDAYVNLLTIEKKIWEKIDLRAS